MKRVTKISFLLIILLAVLSGRVLAENSEEKPPWSYNANDYKYSGELNAVLIKEGEELKSGYLGAFVGDECRGYVDAQRFRPTKRRVFTLLIGSNVTSGETISFRYYDDDEERVYFVKETLPFVSKMQVGSKWTPEEYHVSENSAPEVVQPISDQLLQEGFGTKNINISGTFRDPNGDVLQYTVSVDDPSVVTVSLSGTSLMISEAGSGKAVVTICASDGEFKVCDKFSVTVEVLNYSPVADCSNFSDTVGFYGSGVFTVESICDLFSDPDGDELTFSVTSGDHAVATGELDGCSMDVTVLGVGIATFTICASDGEYEVCCAFDLIVDEENRMELFVMDQPLFEGDTIGHYSDPDTVVLIVYSAVPWGVASEDEWFTVSKANKYNAKIAFSENTTGAARSGSLAVRDKQENVVNLVVYQSADGSVTSVAEVSGGFGVRCYPNPVSGKLTVELEGELFDGEVTLVLFDIAGRKLQEVRAGAVPVDRSVFFLEMDPYTPGVYFLRIADLRGPQVLVPVLKE